jgi:Fe2+ or Zn2+ uptake regulation protein
MQLVELLNKLDSEGILSKLYQAGAATITVYSHRELYNHYMALLATPHFADKKSKAAQATAKHCGVEVATVYRALRAMRQEV